MNDGYNSNWSTMLQDEQIFRHAYDYIYSESSYSGSLSVTVFMALPKTELNVQTKPSCIWQQAQQLLVQLPVAETNPESGYGMIHLVVNIPLNYETYGSNCYPDNSLQLDSATIKLQTDQIMTTKPRVSCTCSICHDGENKAVYTAKDGEKGDYMFIMYKGVKNYTPEV